MLATAGELVFQGSSIGEFAAYDAGSGKRLWQFPAQTGIVAAPISYAVGGRQYVSVAAGWGSIFALLGGKGTAMLGQENHSRILAFSLEGKEQLPAIEKVVKAIPEPPAGEVDAAQWAMGKDLYHERCSVCHGTGAVGGGVLPDLRYASAETHAKWDAIVLGGLLRDRGMPSFAPIFGKADSDAIHAFVIERSRFWYEQQAAAN